MQKNPVTKAVPEAIKTALERLFFGDTEIARACPHVPPERFESKSIQVLRYASNVTASHAATSIDVAVPVSSAQEQPPRPVSRFGYQIPRLSSKKVALRYFFASSRCINDDQGNGARNPTDGFGAE